jgi:Uri superfamily endonuclease
LSERPPDEILFDANKIARAKPLTRLLRSRPLPVGEGLAPGILIEHLMIFCASAVSTPAAPGAYALWLHFASPLDVRVGKISATTLPAGDYLYCGSARGPGGLRARLARHMRKDKRAHWHVDQLTLAGDFLGAFILEGGDECALNAALADLPIPIAGFGSSDCRRCAAHLRFLPKGAALPSRWESARNAAESRLAFSRSAAEAAGRG